MRHALILIALAACTPGPDDDADTDLVDASAGGPGDPGPVLAINGTTIFAAVTDGPGWRGPGGPVVTFDEGDLFTPCASLPTLPSDLDHHNLVVPYRGHLVLPWSPEFGTGGITFYEVSDPCRPVKVGEGTSKQMRETHAMGFFTIPEGEAHAGEYAVVNGMAQPLAGASGMEIWDITDLEAPVPVAFLPLEGSGYPDSYTIVTLSIFVQYPYVYAASANAGVAVADVTDPTTPEQIARFQFPQGLRAGGVFALGTSLLVTPAEEEQAAMLDVSDPYNPQLVPGSPFDVVDSLGEPRETYHGNRAGPYALFDRKEGGGGPLMFDVSDPAKPTYVGDLPLPGMNGGYVFYDEGFLFTGDSHAGHVIDARDPANMTLVGLGVISGDLDTNTPYGNVSILAVDDPGEGLGKGNASQLMPWSTDPDVAPIEILGVDPAEGATGVAITARIGVGFNEMVDPGSVFPGSIRLFDDAGRPVPGWTSAQENTGSFSPKIALKAGTTYTVEVLAGGPEDVNGNALAATKTWTFTTAGTL
ncbi:MAG: Ig-like domain-containing protein [Alphaproteobacteria bacterium]|nr:Ig-like domain-containing protein [Alphaproteobacteria bacterium]